MDKTVAVEHLLIALALLNRIDEVDIETAITAVADGA